MRNRRRGGLLPLDVSRAGSDAPPLRIDVRGLYEATGLRALYPSKGGYPPAAGIHRAPILDVVGRSPKQETIPGAIARHDITTTSLPPVGLYVVGDWGSDRSGG